MREAAENVRQMWETADWQLKFSHIADADDADADDNVDADDDADDDYAHYHLMGNIAKNFQTSITNQI